MRNARRLLAALLAVVMLIPSILVPGYAAETTGFKDVREDSWYANAVDYVSAAGYMKGTSKDAFSPGEDVTRAMFVTILSRVARAQTDNTVSAFGDVAANQYYSGAIEWAAEKEIVNGVGGGLFAPYRSITRQDLAVMLYRFVNAMGYELSAGESRTYTDEAAISAYAADAVRFVTSTGLFAGYQDGSFRPKATATRAQTAVIVMRLAQLLDGQIVDPEPMPAQSFDQTSEQMQVSVNAPEGALPENTRMTVSRVTDEAALAELASKVGAEVLGAADISFAKDGAELEPARKVNVRISLDAIQNAKNPAVVHVKDDGSFEYVASSVVSTRGKADAIEFEADSFSVYAVTDNQTNATLTISFYAQTRGTSGGWEIVNKQIIRANQLGTGKSAIADPGVPNITTSQAFEGWMLEGENVVFNPSFTYNADTTKYSVKQINDYCNENPPSGADKEVVLYAAVYDVAYITYHDQAGAITYAEYVKLSNDGTASKLINYPYNPFKANQNWTGWVPASYVTRAGDLNGSLPTYADGADDAKWPNGSTKTITASVDLYPYLEEGYWLYFDSNKSANNTENGFDDPTSADYTPPVFVAKGKKTAAPTTPERKGYELEGWYTDKAMTTKFTFGGELTEDTTLYAKWTLDTTSYLVVFMVQDADNDYDSDVTNNTYSYYAAVSRDWVYNNGQQTVKTGDPVSAYTYGSGQNDKYLSTGDLTNTTYYPTTISKLGFYYTYSSKNNGVSERVLGDGSTILKVYYDRKPITFNFIKNSTTIYSDTQIYGHDFDPANWPNPGTSTSSSSKYTWYTESTDYFHDYDDPIPSFIPPMGTDDDATVVNFYANTRSVSTDYVTCYQVTQDPDTLSWDGEEDPFTHESGITINFKDDDWPEIKFYGYNLSENSTTSTNFVNREGQVTRFIYGQSSSGYIRVYRNYWVYYTPRPFTVTAMSATTAGTKDFPSLYGKHLKNITKTENSETIQLKQYVPSDAPLGNYFVGWYHDQTHQDPVDWDNDTTPAENSTIYAKWEPMRFRVVCYPKNGLKDDEIVTFKGNQTTQFVLNYNEKVAVGLNTARCEGKMLLGWYLDPECTIPFSFQTLVTNQTEGVDMNYATATARTWTDAWNGNKTETDPENVRGILKLYAKWREDPNGVAGINVTYLGDHAENDKGYFDTTDKPHDLTLQQVFTDGAKAAAYSATVPALPDSDTQDASRRFLYWELLDAQGNVIKTVYPGEPFDIKLSNASVTKTPLPDPNCTHTNEGTSTIASVAAVDPTCTGTGVAAHYRCTKCGRLFTDENGATETTLARLTVAAIGHDWETNTPTYTWSVSTFNEYIVPTCTAELVCGNDETHKLTETVTGQLVVNGTTGYYLAEFEDAHFADQQSGTFTVNRIAVTYQANGETIDELTELVTSGQTVTLPGSEYLPAFTGYTFVGWVQAAVSDTTTAPAYKVPGEISDAITAPTTFYALYSYDVESSGTSTVYKLLTKAPDDWAGNYVITNNSTSTKYVLKGVTGSSSGTSAESSSNRSTLAASGITEDGDILTGVTNTYVMTLAANGSYYTVKSASTGSYYGMNSSSYLRAYTSLNDNYTDWTPAINASGAAQLKCAANGSYPYLGFSADDSYFWAASSSNADVLQLWKETQVSNTVPSYTTSIPTWTVTYSVPSGVTQPESETVLQGQSFTLPTAGAPSGYTFAGWVSSEITTATATQPTILTGSYEPTGNVTLYALYSRDVATGGTYELVTGSQSDWSGNYVITRGNDSSLYAMKGLSGDVWYEGREYGGATPYASTGMSLSGSTLSNVSDYYVFKFATSGSYYTIQNAATGTYVSRIVDATYGPELYALTASYESLDTYNQWTPAYASGNVTLTNYATTSVTDYPMLGFTDANGYFWVDSSTGSNVDNIYLWKETTAAGTTSYYTTAPAALTGYTVSFTVPSGVNAVASQIVTAGESMVLPNAEAPSGAFFVGWAASSVSDTTTAPAYSASGAMYTPTGSTTLCAVYYYTDEYYALQTALPSSVPGTYVISSGTSSASYMLLDRGTTGTLESSSYCTTVSAAGAAISTLDGKTIMRNVPAENRFGISTYSNTYSTYYAIYNNSNLYLYDYYSSSSSYSLRVQAASSTDASTSAWGITYSDSNGTFLLKPYSYSHYIRFNTSGCFELNTYQTGVYLWKYAVDYHYTSSPAATSAVPGAVEVENRKGELIERDLPDAKAQLGSVQAADTQTLTGPTLVPTAYHSPNTNPNPVTATNTYNKVTATSLTAGKKYLITYTSGSTAYIMGNSLNTSSYIPSVSAAVSSNAISGDYDAYLYTVETDSSGYYMFKVGDTSNYFGLVSYYGQTLTLSATSSSSLAKWQWTGAYLMNTGTTTSSGYPYLGYNSSSAYFRGADTSTGNRVTVTFYEAAQSASTDYTISYNANAADATGTMADQTLTAGSGTLTANAFTRSGYTFAGWNTAADGTGKAYANSASVTLTANLTLYAQWVKTPGSDETVTYELATSLTAGEDYVVVIGNYAVGNTTVTSGHYLNAQSVTVNSNNTITVPASAASSVLWHATGTTSGWSFYNQSANGFIGLSSDYYLSIESNFGRAWTYDGTDLNNNCVDDGNKVTDTSSSYYGSYYYYLAARSTASTGFTTTPSTGNNVKFYKRVITAATTTYNVTVASGITNGTVSADKETAAAGETVTLTVTPDVGYELATLTVTDASNNPVTVTNNQFTMPASNVTVNATFTASSGPAVTTKDIWVPTDTIETGKDYLIGFVVDGGTYLAVNYSESNTNHYYYSSSSNYYGYTALASIDANGYVTDVSGNTADLTHCTWKFSSTTGGTISSGYESGRYLATYSYTTYHDLYPASSTSNASGWVWNKDDQTLTRSIDGTTMYAEHATLSGTGHFMGMFSTRTTTEYVQLYKKQTVNVYNVTVNPTENGTVRANKSTATAGETVTLTLTPSEGYTVDTVTVTDSNGAQVTLDGAAGRYTFTMPASNVTVTATFKQAATDNQWVVSFEDEDGYAISGMNDVYVQKNTANNLTETMLPNPAKSEQYFLGWYLGDTKCTFPMTVSSDIVLTPKYSPMYAYDYTITLRAVYGPYNPDATTHIYWYANNGTEYHNGAGERYVSTYTEGGVTTTKIPINGRVDIPVPTATRDGATPFVGDEGGALTWDDHVFLGWARVDNGGSADYAEARILTPDDIYLKWTGDHYEYRQADGTFSENWTMQQVTADETTPYHDMYAVWAGFYYIYHSSDGTLEAVQVPFDGRETKDLVAEAESKSCLYGGYYKDSGAVVSVDAAEMRAAKNSILNQQNFWNYTDSCVASGSVTETSLTEEGAVVYNGTSINHTVDNVTVRFWQKGQAYTALGTELVPTAGTVYYLKEVPKTFLPNRLVYVKADKDTTFSDGTTTVEKDEITNLYLMTALDDRNYAENGFFIGKAHSDQDVTSLDENSGSANSVSRVFIIAIKKGDTYEQHRYNAHDLNEDITVPNGVDADLVGFVAATNLGLEWIRNNRGKNDGSNVTFYLKPYWTTLDGVTVEQDNLMGVNISSDGKSIGSVTFN